VIVMNTRAAIAYATGAVRDSATYLERTLEMVRPIGDPAWIASLLSAAATFHAMAGDPDAAVPLATEGLALARRVEMPTLITSNLAALAGALADEDPERARALLRESIELRATLDYENWGELTQAVRTPRGYQVLKLESSTQAQVLPFEQAREQISEKVFTDKRRDEFQKYITKLRSQAIIEWKNDEVKAAYQEGLAQQAKEVATAPQAH